MVKKISDNEIEDLAREKRNSYQRMWRKKNKEKVNHYQNKYWEKLAYKDLMEREM